MEIKFYNYKKLFNNKFSNQIISNLKMGQFILGKEVLKLEKNLKKFLKIKNVITCSNATSALEIGLKNLNYPANSEIIVPSHTFIASANGIINAGHIPVIAEINETGLVDPIKLKKYISAKTKAIVIVNLNGMMCDIEKIIKICKENKIDLIEENAQAFGAKYKNKLSRSFSKFSVQSFYPTKILGAYGDSGAICTNSNNFAKKLKAYTNHGRVNQKVRFEGENSRLDNIQALVLNLNIKEVKKKIRQRRMLANNYYDLLKNNKNILFPFKIKRDDKKIYYDVFQNFEILVNKRDRLKKFLKKNNIETLVQWNGVGLNKIKLKKIKTIGNYHYTNSYFNKSMCLPIGDHITSKQVIYISRKINEFFEEN